MGDVKIAYKGREESHENATSVKIDKHFILLPEDYFSLGQIKPDIDGAPFVNY